MDRQEATKKVLEMVGIEPNSVFTRLGQAQRFIEAQPLFYDISGLWWIWDFNKCCYKLSDEVEILNRIEEEMNIDTISSKSRNEIINALKQVGRKHIPQRIQPTWIQFKNKIIDITTGNIFEATSKYFATNPIPWELHPNNYVETPNMNRIFEEWVGKDYVKTLYEILSYCLLPDYPINRLFCFLGAGMNGKTKFLDLVSKFIGIENCTSTELDVLLNSRFEITRLHKKLVCQMGETNFNEMKKTSILKKLTGGDLIGFEYKNKDLFQDKNYAKILISTNSLPTTDDKSIGFYRRWMIIDFPNQFSEKKDILADIPDEEYKALALKCTFILKDLLEKREFYNEGSVEDRKEKFEAKSNFLKEFTSKFIIEDSLSYITIADFNKKFASWCKENRHREMSDTSIGMKMKKEGFEQERKYMDWLYDGKGGQIRVWVGVKWKD